MSEKIGPVYYNEREEYVSPQKQAEIDAEIRRYVQRFDIMLFWCLVAILTFVISFQWINSLISHVT